MPSTAASSSAMSTSATYTGATPRIVTLPRKAPAFRVIDGGRSERVRRRRQVYRRRRIGAVVVLVVGLLVAVRLTAALAGFAGDVLSSPAPAPEATPLSPAQVSPAAARGLAPGGVYVVQPGDSLWSIASTVAPDGDPRAVVDELADRAGGPTLEPGQRIDVAGLGG